MKKILVVGQTPPPFGGQAIMIELMLNGKYQGIEFSHVRMAFSKEMDEIGKVKLFKIFHLFTVVYQIIYARIIKGIDILYYPPTGPNKVPFYRDAFILVLVRPFFRKTCFHFHASGISELYEKLGSFSRLVFRAAYYNADLGIRLSSASPQDCSLLKAKHESIVPNGIEDHYSGQLKKIGDKPCTILFVGLLNESKGLLMLIEACNLLNKKGLDFHVKAMGKFESERFESQVKNRVKECGLEERITFLGVLTGNSKYEQFTEADIFCFPTFFEAENFPVVLLEASSFALPIVSSQWRGVPSIVKNEETGFLCPVKDFACVAERLQTLIEQPELRMTLGNNGRAVFLEKFTISKFYQNMEDALSLL